MSGDIPPWMDDVPPPNAPANVGKGDQQPQRRTGAPRAAAPVATAEDGADFFEWLNSPQTRLDLESMLPSYLPATQFIQFAKEAALSNPRLLAPNLRPSLLRAIGKLAKMGLRSDGKEAALVPRYDAGTRQYGIVAQSMVWGTIKLGRLTGAIKTIRPIIVFTGEQFEMEEGDEPRWIHKVDRELVDDAYQALYGGMTTGDNPRLLVNSEEFFRRVSCAYCIITSSDGTVAAKRWMSAKRIDLIRKQQGKNTPWYGPFVDEMIIKTVILYTAKHLDLDISNPATRAFREALLDDVGTDDFEALAPPEPAKQVAIGHETKLQQFENLFGARKETADLVPEKQPWRERVSQVLFAATGTKDVEALSAEPWFRDGMAALRAEDEGQAEEMVRQLVKRSEELGG